MSLLPAPWPLLEMRARIRLVDTQLISLLSERFRILAEVRAFKQEHGLPVHDPQRESDVLAHCCDLAASLDVPVTIVSELYRQLFVAARGAGSFECTEPRAIAP